MNISRDTIRPDDEHCETLEKKLTLGTFESFMSHSWWGCCCCWLPATVADIVGDPTRLLRENRMNLYLDKVSMYMFHNFVFKSLNFFISSLNYFSKLTFKFCKCELDCSSRSWNSAIFFCSLGSNCFLKSNPRISLTLRNCDCTRQLRDKNYDMYLAVPRAILMEVRGCMK